MARQIIKCMSYDMLNAAPVTGQIYFCSDIRVLYKDNGPTKESRLRFNAVVLYSDNERLNSIKPVIGKFYYVEETNSLWLFDTRWVLKIGDTTQYNSYINSYSSTYNGQYISPVINYDTSITNSTGDKIIDNNGLLGDGSVAIRDANRTVRGLMHVSHAQQQLIFSSYLDNGFLFIPNSHLPYTDLSTSLGALHLTVDRDLSDVKESLDFSGQAYYYGTWNNYGDMYIVNKTKNDVNVKIDDTPNLNNTIIKLFILCTKIDTNELDEEIKKKTYITIRPVSDTQAIANVITVDESNAYTVTHNDIGELLYTDASILEDNTTFDCTRTITYSNGQINCIYTFDNYENGVQIVLTENESTGVKNISVPTVWTGESGSVDDYYFSVWTKKKVLTEDDIDSIKASILNQINANK